MKRRDFLKLSCLGITSFAEENKIHWKNSHGCEEWYKYDEKNNLVHWKNNHREEWWKKYDEKNNEIYSKDSNGKEKWREYDKNNNLIYYKNHLVEYKKNNYTEIESLGGIWDYREDDEGITFGKDMIDPKKVQNIKEFIKKQHKKRKEAIGFIIQEK